jgi:hypothetical protein
VYVAFLVQPELSDKFLMKRSKSMRHKWFHCRLEPILYLRFGWLVPTTNRAGFSVCATRARCYCTTRPYAFARPRTRFALGMNKIGGKYNCRHSSKLRAKSSSLRRIAQRELEHLFSMALVDLYSRGSNTATDRYPRNNQTAQTGEKRQVVGAESMSGHDFYQNMGFCFSLKLLFFAFQKHKIRQATCHLFRKKSLV